MKHLTPLVLLLAAGCLKQGSSMSHPKPVMNKLTAADLDGRVGQEFRGHIYYTFEAPDSSVGYRRAVIEILDPLPPGLKKNFNPHSSDMWINGRPTQAGTWTLKILISDPPSGRKLNESITIVVK